MRTTYLVCYDICHEKRLRKVFKTCRNYRDPLQYSVFEFTKREFPRLNRVAPLKPIPPDEMHFASQIISAPNRARPRNIAVNTSRKRRALGIGASGHYW
jgi:CRISPR associated protein Cas2